MIVSVDDLSTFLGGAEVDTDRALLLLQLSEDLCASIVDPVPASARVVVLTVASRSFTNPTGVTSETVGPYTVQRGTPGLYLTKADKATLRRLGGGTGAFSIDTLPTGTSAVQTVAIAGSPTGGTFTLGFAGQVSSAIPFDASAAQIASALSSLPNLLGNVTVGGSGPFTLTFGGDLANSPIPTFLAVSSLTGGSDPGVLVVTTTPGIFGPGQNLPYWDSERRFF